MAVFKVETKNKIDIDKKSRVYFTCHPEDFEKSFKKICDDILKTHDCAIYYTEDMAEVIAEDEMQVDLGRNNLFVVPVTFKLLTTPNRAMDEDIPYALKEHIPILPIMMEPGIDEFYSKPDKFGEMQYLNPYSTDLTEISYEEKLKKYLESVLISDELAKRVRAAFDAYIFLSYRKKDRKYANELMRLIHSIPECRDIAIWFDEFLTPGESFKENIEKILDDCKLFTLLVTPQLLEKFVDKNGEEWDNYVLSTELPLARKKKEEKGTDILAVEMEKTDKDALSKISIEDYTNPENADFRARLLETISRMAITTNNTPEHNFLIGLAYLEGIDVEVDRGRAVELITLAAEFNLPEAMKKITSMYIDGVAVLRNYKKANEWQKRIVNFYDVSYLKSPNNDNGWEYAFSMYKLANMYSSDGNESAEIYFDRTIKCCEKFYEKYVNTDYLVLMHSSLLDFGCFLMNKKDFTLNPHIPIFFMKSKEIANKLIETINFESGALQLAQSYRQLGHYSHAVKNSSQAIKYFLSAINTNEKLSKQTFNLKRKKCIALDYRNIADVIYGDERYPLYEALEYYLKAYKLDQELSEIAPDDMKILNALLIDISNICNMVHKFPHRCQKVIDKYNLSNYDEYYLEAIKISEKIAFKTNAPADLDNLAVAYFKYGMVNRMVSFLEKALEIYNQLACEFVNYPRIQRNIEIINQYIQLMQNE